MKKLVEMVKMFILSMVVAVMMPAMTCQAIDYQSVSVTELKDIIGNWYDTNGNLVLSISRDYKLNGCPIISVGFIGDASAMYKIRINEGNNYRDIEVCHDDSGYGMSGYHERLIMNWGSNSAYSLRRTKHPRYFESIGGIYLGMSKNQVLSLYGQPSKVETRHRFSTWKYNDDGFDVEFRYNIVEKRTIYSYGNRKFDRTGVSAKDNFQYVINKYNAKPFDRNYSIGYGECISNDRTSGVLSLVISWY